MNRRKFIATGACCAAATCGLLCNNSLLIEFPYHKEHKSKWRIDIHLVEHCNLKCKYCSHFANIAQKEFYDLDIFKQDVNRMSQIITKEHTPDNIALLGGEPLLNPDILEYVKYTRKCFPELNLTIATNATLLDDMDEKFWKTLNEHNITLSPSVYPIKINWKSILDKAKKYNITVWGISRVNGYKGEITMENLDRFTTTHFFKLALNENMKAEPSKKCINRNVCLQLAYGKLYTCQTIAYIRHLNKKFNTNFIVTEDDYIDIYKISGIKDVLDFTENRPFHFCRYCSTIDRKVKWETSLTHDISEWT